jgi:signal transduction histidine kinase
LLVTLLVTQTPLVSSVHRSVPLHVTVETTATLVSLFAALLVHGRFRRTLRAADLVLVASLGTFALTNLTFSLLPGFMADHPGSFRTWSQVGGTCLAATLFAVAPFGPDRIAHRPAAAERRVLLGCVACVAVIALAVLAAGDRLPPALPASVVPEPPRWPHFVGHPAVLAAQTVTLLLFVAAAVGFGSRAARTGDGLLRWLAIAGIFGAFARLNYALLPSLYTEWVSAGDALRLACFLCIFAGAVHETRRLQRALASAAVLDERRRIARDLHDGVTQDLAFIVQQTRHMADREGATVAMGRVANAAQRALDESREATAALVRPSDCLLADAIAATAREAAEREGSVVQLDLDPDVAVPAQMQQEILRVVREAVINAARHGGAHCVRVRLCGQPQISISVADDGRGFEPGAAGSQGRFGLESMAARVEAIGGGLSISSAPGAGSEVLVTLP